MRPSKRGSAASEKDTSVRGNYCRHSCSSANGFPRRQSRSSQTLSRVARRGGVDRDLGDVHWRAGAPRTLSLVRLPATSSWREVALEDKPGETVTAVGAFTVDAVTGQLSRSPGDHRLESLVPEVLV